MPFVVAAYNPNTNVFYVSYVYGLQLTHFTKMVTFIVGIIKN